MGYAVTAVLERRLEETARVARLDRCLAGVVGAHAVLLAAAIWLPALQRAPVRPLQYVAVQIVPAAKLGVERPKPAVVKPREEARPEPKKPDSRPAKPETTAPKAPSTTAKKPPEPEPPPEPETEGAPTGSASGLALGAAVAGLENPDFTYGYYVDQMLGLLQRNWVRPLIGSGVEATVYYRIQRDGRITDLAIVKSSGINSFDLASLRAVQSSSPLPPLPRAYRHGYLGVTLVFR